ncbi:hypothetical protein TrST_g12947 [Triparma strigata]|uniref:Uncharacterized protein n=1 Tax=Triparma strigata TaxID=1606541 RepID=A0A9W7BFN4_9STRA|nr:hypothetical protein TrST_g12947 [Triparma strigata]
MTSPSNKVAPDITPPESPSTHIRKASSGITKMVSSIQPFLEENKIFQKVELYGTAIVSIVDMGTDIMTILKFHNSGRGSYANATLACVSTNLFLQSLHVFIVNAKKSRWIKLREQLIVFTLIKPGVDAYRASTSYEAEADSFCSPREELTIHRTIEMVAESIPTSVIQMAALISSTEVDVAQFLAILSSVCTAGFMSALISYDWDTSKENRLYSPKFYGYIPHSRPLKVLIFVNLFLMSSCNLVVRALSVCVLATKGGSFAVAILLAEMALYYVIKTMRGDLWYWPPMTTLGKRLVNVVFNVSLIKLAVDWSLVVQFRHPQEVGGAYFSFSLLVTVAIGLISLNFYEEPEGSWEKSRITLLMTSCCGIFLCSFALFLASINRKYLHTFVSTLTACQYISDIFTDNPNDDEARSYIFSRNEQKWKSVRDQCKAWLNERLPAWICEQPDWFNDYRKSLIPDHMVDDKRLMVQLKTKNVEAISARRRSSLSGLG